MIASLNGKLIYKDASFAVIECCGIGFKVSITANTLGMLPNINENVFIHTYTSVKEDTIDLYGFADTEELELFKLLISVSGVGAKIAIAMLSSINADKLSLYIASGDAKALTQAPGVGIKLAQRVILELKDKLGKLGISHSENISAVGNASLNTNTKEAVAALVSLGYSQSEASLAVGKLDYSLPTADLIKQALKYLSRQG